jgi:hypothetical protein
MRYRDNANEYTLTTGIHTQINEKYRISSCYRKFANEHFEIWAWETFLWKGDRIEEQYDTLSSADETVDLHTEILNDIRKRG